MITAGKNNISAREYRRTVIFLSCSFRDKNTFVLIQLKIGFFYLHLIILSLSYSSYYILSSSYIFILSQNLLDKAF